MLPLRSLRGLLPAVPLLLGAAFGCAAPTIPLPPPTLPAVTLGAGTITLSAEGGAYRGALIVAVNRNTSYPSGDRAAATLADDQGAWKLTLRGGAGDVIDVTQQIDGTESPPVTVVAE